MWQVNEYRRDWIPLTRHHRRIWVSVMDLQAYADDLDRTEVLVGGQWFFVQETASAITVMLENLGK